MISLQLITLIFCFIDLPWRNQASESLSTEINSPPKYPLSPTGQLTHGKPTTGCNVVSILPIPLKWLKVMLRLSLFAPISPAVMDSIVVFLPFIINTILFLSHVIHKKQGQSKLQGKCLFWLCFPCAITAAHNAVQFAQTDPQNHIPKIHKHAILYLKEATGGYRQVSSQTCIFDYV